MADATQNLPHEIRLSLRAGLTFKFHVLLECSERRMTTLAHGSLQFITKDQKIIDSMGKSFNHPLTKEIWELVVKCTKLGDGKMITLPVPFNDKTGEFDWETPNTKKKDANLWVRVFEVGSARIAEATAIKADIDMVGKRYAYWKRVQVAVRSEPMMLESCNLSWREAIASVDEEVLEAQKKFADTHKGWMKPTKIEQ